MIGKACHECVDKCFRDITSNDLSFGGQVMVHGGKVCQVLPLFAEAAELRSPNLSCADCTFCCKAKS